MTDPERPIRPPPPPPTPEERAAFEEHERRAQEREAHDQALAADVRAALLQLGRRDLADRLAAEGIRPTDEPRTRPMTTVKVEPVDWLIDGALPAGMLCLLGGNGGTGKSTLSSEWASQLSRRSIGTLWYTCEEPEGRVRERFEAMQADLGPLEISVAATTLPADESKLRDDIARVRARGVDLRLIVFDTIADLHGGDGDKHTDTRRTFRPLVALARDLGVCVLGLIHTKKASDGSPADRFMGSAAVKNLARHALMLAPDGERDVLVTAVKSNVAARYETAWRFRLAGDKGPRTVEWKGQEAMTEADFLARLAPPEASKPSPASDKAQAWLREHLEPAGTWHESATVLDAATAAGHARRTLWRAKTQLGVRARKTKMRGGWEWALPEDAPEPDGDDHYEGNGRVEVLYDGPDDGGFDGQDEHGPNGQDDVPAEECHECHQKPPRAHVHVARWHPSAECPENKPSQRETHLALFAKSATCEMAENGLIPRGKDEECQSTAPIRACARDTNGVPDPGESGRIRADPGGSATCPCGGFTVASGKVRRCVECHRIV